MGTSMMGILAHAAFVQSLFTLDVQPRIAAEGGPVVFDVTATYTGSRPIGIYEPDERFFSIQAPPSWNSIRREPKPQIFSSRLGFFNDPVPKVVAPGYKIQRTILFHRLFVGRIPRGPATFIFDFRVGCQLAKECYLVARVQKSVRVDVEPFSKELANKLQQQLLRQENPFFENSLGDYKNKYAELVLNTRHAEFVPLALSLIAQRPNLESELREFVYSVSSDPSAIHREFADDLISGNSKYNLIQTHEDWSWRELPSLEILERYFMLLNFARRDLYGRQGKGPLQMPYYFTRANDSIGWLFQRLPDPLLKKMQKEGNLWVKTLVYVTFPNRVSTEWKQGVLKDLQERVKPLPEELLNRWFGKLDSDQYQERELGAGSS